MSRTWERALRALREDDTVPGRTGRPGVGQTREIVVRNSFDITVPGEGTFRVEASTPEEAKQGIVTWFREDQGEGQGREIDPSTLRVTRTVKEAFGEMEDQAWNVRNRKTGQVFSHVVGRTPMDAKKKVLAMNPLLKGVTALDLEADPMANGMGVDQGRQAPPRQPTGSQPAQWPSSSRGSRFTPNEPYSFDDETTLAEPPKPSASSVMPTAAMRGPRRPSVRKISDEGVGAAAMGANGPSGRDPMTRDEAVRHAVRAMVREVVRKKAGGGGYALYAPNKGKKKSPKPVGEFPTRLAAKNAELARFPPKDPEQLKKLRARLDKIKKDPEKRATAEKQDLSGRKKAKRSGAPARERKRRKESLVRLMARDLHERLFRETPASRWKVFDEDSGRFLEIVEANSAEEACQRFADILTARHKEQHFPEGLLAVPAGVNERLFHEDEVPGSPWDERIASLHPDAISSDRKLHALHRGLEKASIGALGDAHKGLARCLRGMAKVNPGDIAHDPERNKTFMPVMMDCDGFEIGPVHLYVDGGHVKVEVSREARDAIAQLEPDAARDLRGGLMSFEEDHLPKIDGAQKAWAARDGYLDKLHGRLERHAAGLSGVEHHLMKGLLVKGGKGK